MVEKAIDGGFVMDGSYNLNNEMFFNASSYFNSAAAAAASFNPVAIAAAAAAAASIQNQPSFNGGIDHNKKDTLIE